MQCFPTSSLLLAACALSGAVAVREEPAPHGPAPTDRQLRWHELEACGRISFSVNTFTDRESGFGDEPEAEFAPAAFDADQIVRVLVAAGFEGAILVAKHHDGFCLWPTKTTQHSVAQSPFRSGKGDVVREIAEACKARGLPFGIELSAWDRNHPAYGKPAYVEDYRAQLRELLLGYGPVFQLGHDGSSGGEGYYGGARESRTIDRKSYYGWPATWELARTLMPEIAIRSDMGPDLRAAGDESGRAGETCWATYSPHGAAKADEPAPGATRSQEAASGHRDGRSWMPLQCAASLRPGRFWREGENEKVKSTRELVELWFESVGRGANLLLDVPPDRRGIVHEKDEAVLRAFGAWRRATFETDLARGASATPSNVRAVDLRFAAAHLVDGDDATYFATDDDVKQVEIVFELAKRARFDVVRIREEIRLGQRVDEFAVDVWKDDGWREAARGTSIGARRLIKIEPVSTDRVRLRILAAAAAPCLRDFGLFRAAALKERR